MNGEEINGSFYEKELQKTTQKEFRIERVLKRKGDKFYVKWKGYDNRFNSIQDGRFRGCSRMGGPFLPPSLKSAAHILQ